MNILIAPDKFKDAASASEICIALEEGIKQSLPSANCQLLPLADGGEGTLESIAMALEVEWKYLEVLDPLFRPIQACYLLIPKRNLAIIEMARASGIELLKSNERNCLLTSSIGTGQLILDAISHGIHEIILTVGGTATNDAGIGVASALGFQFLDENNQVLSPIGENLINIHHINDELLFPNLKNIKFTIATDVENPFYGNRGAAFAFAKQKGASDEVIFELNQGLFNFASVLENYSSLNPQLITGSGAGGGVAGGLACLLNAEIISAAHWILTLNDVPLLLRKSQVLITGEGKVDAQTWEGKLISQLLKMAKESQIPVIVVCGTLQDIDILAKQDNIIYAKSILNQPMSLQDAILNTIPLLKEQGILLGKFLPII